MQKALEALDRRLPKKTTILIGGGSAMLLRHGIALSTSDIDALVLSSELTPAEIDPLVKGVARDLGISPHWYNDYFNTFTFSLPNDFRSRLKPVFEGKNLTALALGKEDLLVMKCFAGREKDVGHARVLLKKGADEGLVEGHLNSLAGKKVPGADKALRLFHDLLDERGG